MNVEETTNKPAQVSLLQMLVVVTVAGLALALLKRPLEAAWKDSLLYFPMHLLGRSVERLTVLSVIVAPIAIIAFVVRLVTIAPPPLTQIAWMLALCANVITMLLGSGVGNPVFAGWCIAIQVSLAAASLVETWLRCWQQHWLTWLLGAFCTWTYWCVAAIALAFAG